MRHLVNSSRYSVVPINSSQLNIALYSPIRIRLFYNDTKYSFQDVKREFDSIPTQRSVGGRYALNKQKKIICICVNFGLEIVHIPAM